MRAARCTQALTSILIASLSVTLAHAQAPTPEFEDFFGWSLAAGDFNADGYADLAVGVPNQDVNGKANAGAVDIYYGTSTGFSAPQVWTQSTSGVPGASEPGDRFGHSLATGDFNGDGVSDLAVGVPSEDFASNIVDDGGVLVLYGMAQVGLAASGSQFWGQTSGLPFAAEAGDGFGETLAAGDFNGDRCDDLAVGVPREDIGTLADAGAVGIIFGSPATATAVNGLQKASPVPQGWFQDSIDISGVSEAGDQFGFALAAADFNQDGKADLAIGAPDEAAGSDGSDGYAGVVNLIYGSASGLNAAAPKRNEIFELFTFGREGLLSRFGAGLAAGDFDGNGTVELAVAGSPRRSAFRSYWVGGGAWVVKLGAGSPTLLRDLSGWGDRIAVGDFNGDRRKDLVHDRDFPSAFRVDYGSESGVSLVAQASPGVQVSQTFPYFQSGVAGGTLGKFAFTSGDFNNDGKSDLAIGNPFAILGVQNTPTEVKGVGSVNVLYGSLSGVGLAGNVRLLDSPCEYMEQAGDCNDTGTVDSDGVDGGV